MDIDELATYIRQHRPAAHRKGYPPEVRSRACDAIAEYRRAGMSWGRIASVLGISTTTLHRWQSSRSLDETPSFVPMVLEPEPDSVEAESIASMRSLHLPGGMHVSGLSFEDVLGLARALR